MSENIGNLEILRFSDLRYDKMTYLINLREGGDLKEICQVNFDKGWPEIEFLKIHKSSHDETRLDCNDFISALSLINSYE